jgi:hypothetical protein
VEVLSVCVLWRLPKIVLVTAAPAGIGQPKLIMALAPPIMLPITADIKGWLTNHMRDVLIAQSLRLRVKVCLNGRLFLDIRKCILLKCWLPDIARRNFRVNAVCLLGSIFDRSFSYRVNLLRND